MTFVIILLIGLIILVYSLITRIDKLSGGTPADNQDRSALDAELMNQLRQTHADFENLRQVVDEKLAQVQSQNTDNQTQSQQTLTALQQTIDEKLHQIQTQSTQTLQQNHQAFSALQQTIDEKLNQIQTRNQQALDQMRQTVDEKLEATLQTRLKQTFNNLNQQLANVNQSIGEMQSLSADVANLNRTLAGTKTRGIVGEVQLGMIIDDILTTNQYEHEIPTVPNSTAHVEYAIKLPGADGQTMWLPVDSKFPLDRYQAVLEASEAGDSDQMVKARKALATQVKSFANDIHTKYLQPPYTTNFGIMFLPTEGLYAEVVRDAQLIEDLRRQESVVVAGPSTIAAILNSLALGFKTLNIQQNAVHIGKTLGTIKTEFEKFDKLLQTAQKHLNNASHNLDDLMTTRTNAIERAFRAIDEIESESKD